MPNRLIQIDELNRSAHHYLNEDDECYYVMEYTSGRDYQYSDTNSLIKNFKKGLDRKDQGDFKYKEVAIRRLLFIFREILTREALKGITIVPMPSSKSKDDPLYDNRVVQLLNRLTSDFGADIREILYLEESIEASHERQDRPSPDELEELFLIDESLCKKVPKKIMIFDDMVTAGAHFRAAKNILQAKFPKAEIIGVFIARRVLPQDEQEP